MNASALAKVSAMQKLESIIREYEQEIGLPKKQIGFYPNEVMVSQQKQF